jgi:zinc D-Ala-D-Ala carboxypeptidase
MFKEILNEKPAAPGLPTVNLDLDFSRKLTQNFRLSEFACKHCGAVSISPGFAELVARLQVLRDKAGKPVNVTSGYRCATHDARVGTSASPGRGPHTTGTAADIYISGMTVDKLAQLANESGFTGIGRYHGQGFVHVDLRQPPSYFVG